MTPASAPAARLVRRRLARLALSASLLAALPATAAPDRAADRSPAPAPRVGLARFAADARGGAGQIEVSGLHRAVVWWEAPASSGYDLDGATVNRGWANGAPSAYVIEATAGGEPWTTLVDVPSTTLVTASHLVDLAGFTRVRMRLTGPVAGSGPIDLAVHDARAGAEDHWLFLGDSNTELVFGGRTEGDAGRFGALVHAHDPARWPIALNGGVSAGLADHFLRTRADPWSDAAHDGTGDPLFPGAAGQPQPLVRRWMQRFGGRYVSIGIGTNDINGFSWRPATDADLDALQRKVERVVEEARAAGKTVILPTLRWCTTNPYTARNIAAWNERLWHAVLPRYPDVVRGPDLYAGSVGHPEWLEADRSHPNAAGRAATRRQWIEWAFATVYAR